MLHWATCIQTLMLLLLTSLATLFSCVTMLASSFSHFFKSFSTSGILPRNSSAVLCMINQSVNQPNKRSANTNLLSAPCVRTTFASGGFSVAAPAVWNSLPSGIRDSSSTTHTFRRLLKTHCFQQAFGSP